jgi:hypothetical protein
MDASLIQMVSCELHAGLLLENPVRPAHDFASAWALKDLPIIQGPVPAYQLFSPIFLSGPTGAKQW